MITFDHKLLTMTYAATREMTSLVSCVIVLRLTLLDNRLPGFPLTVCRRNSRIHGIDIFNLLSRSFYDQLHTTTQQFS